MSSVSPTVEGFRAAFRRPSLTLAEITWRWVFGTTATALFFFGLFEYLDTLPVTSADILFLRTRNPFLASQAFAHILRGSLNRAVLSLLLAAVLLVVVWMFAASLGRIATVEAMLGYFRTRFAVNQYESEREPESNTTESAPGLTEFVRPGKSESGAFTGLLFLNFLRVAVIVATFVGIAGAALLAGLASPPTHPRPGVAFLLLVPVVFIVALIGYELNWLLSLAAVFVVRDGDDAVGSIASAVALCRERSGPVFAVTTWTGIAHLIAFVGASAVVGFPIGLAGVLPWRAIASLVILVTLVYLAFAEWLYTARLAGYVCITEMPDALLAPPQPPIIPTPSETIDRDELILSDVPNLVVET